MSMLPKAEIHCHIEGAASPALVLKQAEKYNADMSAFIRGDAYVWQDFTSFLASAWYCFVTFGSLSSSAARSESSSLMYEMSGSSVPSATIGMRFKTAWRFRWPSCVRVTGGRSRE